METIEQQQKKTFSLNDTPWFFGAYLNQARHNLFLSLNDLTLKLGGKPIANDDSIGSCKAVDILGMANPNPNELEKAVAHYEKNMPFLFSMQYRYSTEEEKNIRMALRDEGKRPPQTKNLSAGPQRYYEILKLLIQALNDARNHFTHYNPQPWRPPRELYYLLNDAFDVNTRIVKHRRNLNDAQVLHLRRFDGVDGKGRDKKARPNPKFWYHFSQKNDTDAMSEYGLAFLTSLFLTKGEAYLFLKKISGFKRSDTPEYAATVEAFCTGTLRPPKERLESDNSAMAVFLDMCNELARCPKELFEHLEPEKQQLFIKNMQAEEQEENAGEDVPEPEERDEPESKLVRNSSRFTFFAQRYIDITGALPQLRFAVDLGTYHYSIYPKTIAGITENRQLTKRLIGYGRLEDFDKSKRPAAFQQLFKDTEAMLAAPTEPYIRETYPHYHTEGQNIPLYAVPGEAHWPVITTTPTDGEKSYPNKLVKDKEPKPYAILSEHELPMLVFYHYLQSGQGKGADAQAIIMQQIRHTRKFFEQVSLGNIQPVSTEPMTRPAGALLRKRQHAEYNRRFALLQQLLAGYGLATAQIPEQMADILMNISPADWKQQAQRRLDEMIVACEEMVERMEQRETADIKPGKKAFRRIKVGKLADLLAEDMLLMQPVLKNGDGTPILSSKANSSAFRLLQSHLAYFGQHKQNMRQIFIACNLLDSANPHPFLPWVNIENKAGVIDFYKGYFNAKKAYLEDCRQAGQYEQYYFLNVKAHAGSLQSLAAALLNQQAEQQNHVPFNLPRGLFLKACLDWLAANGSDAMKDCIAQQPEINSVHLLNQYFAREQQDESQVFYNWPRQYRAFNTVKGKNEVPVYYLLEQRAGVAAAAKTGVDALKKRLPQLEQEAQGIAGRVFDKQVNLSGTGPIKQYALQQYAERFPRVAQINWDRLDNRNLKRDAAKKIEGAVEDSLKDCHKQISAYQYFTENEKYLRLVQAQDKLLFLCIGRLLAQKTGAIEVMPQGGDNQLAADTFLLKNISPEKDAERKNLLNCRPAAGIGLRLEYFEVAANGAFRKNAENKKIPAGEVRVVDTHLKIKNAGNFRRRLKDRRMNNLCFYFEKDATGGVELNRMVLENELRQYDALRLPLLERVAAFEKAWFEKYREQAATLLCNEKGVQEHKRYLAHFFSVHPQLNINGLQETLNAIRNGFAHNQYPLLTGPQYLVAAGHWRQINAAFAPGAAGSTLGYGVIERLTEAGMQGYEELINHIK